MKRKLCPRITDSMSFVGFKIYDSLLAEVDNVSHVEVTTRSEAVRRLIVEALRARGRVMTAAEMRELAA